MSQRLRRHYQAKHSSRSSQVTEHECAEAAILLFDADNAREPIPEMSIQDLCTHMNGRVSMSALKLLISHMTFCIASGEGSERKKEKKGGSQSGASSSVPMETSETLTLRAIIAAEKAIQSELSAIHDTILPEMEVRQKKLLSAVVRGRMALNPADSLGGSAAAPHSATSLPSLTQSLPPRTSGNAGHGFGQA